MKERIVLYIRQKKWLLKLMSGIYKIYIKAKLNLKSNEIAVICNANAGDTFLFCSFLYELKKCERKDIVVIAKIQHKEIIEMFEENVSRIIYMETKGLPLDLDALYFENEQYRYM